MTGLNQALLKDHRVTEVEQINLGQVFSKLKKRPSFTQGSMSRDVRRDKEGQKLIKRPPEPGSRFISTRKNYSNENNSSQKPSNRGTYLNSFATRLSKKYQERMPNQKEVLMISLPDHTIKIEAILEALNGSMINELTKSPSPIFQELAALVKLSTECLIGYRDDTDGLLLIYFKRLKNESIDSIGHQFSIVQTHLTELRERKPSEHPNKLRLIIKDISMYINLQELTKKLSHRGQNRHYFIFSPDYLGTVSKRSIAFNRDERQYEINYEDLTMERFGTYGTSNAVITVTMPLLSYCLFFDFDFTTSIVNCSTKLVFTERYEEVLRNQKSESFLLSNLEASKFVDFIETHRKYCNIVENIIERMKQEQSIIRLVDNSNHLFFDVDVLDYHLRNMPMNHASEIGSWFNFNSLANKAFLYTAINQQYRLTNIIDLPPNLAKRMGWHPGNPKLFGLLAYHSQAEYTNLLKSLLVPDSSSVAMMK